MSLINKTYNKAATAEVSYPGISEFVITIAFVNREELTDMIENSSVFKFNKGTRQREKETNTDKFLELYADKAILGWKGLKVKHLPQLYPADISNLNPEDLVPFNKEDALDLLKVSTDFDRFITDAMNDLDSFNRQVKEEQEKNLKSTSPKS